MAGKTAGAARKYSKFLKGVSLGVLCLGLAACDENGNFSLGAATAEGGTEVTRAANSVQLVERDVEAPEVFQVTEAGLWDGRPSLGGVWVAHPDVTEPERVIIRNRENGKFVIGALFRRERANPGPELQVSSDAANALGLLAGAPGELNVTALRREEVTETVAAPGPDLDAATTTDLAAPTEVTATSLDPIAGAAAAIDAAEASAAPAAVAAAAPAVAEAPAPRPTPAAASTLQKPFIQIGIFSVEANATRTADRMRSIGIVPTVLAQESQGKPFWRVIVGPTQDTAERAALLEKVKGQGFGDAYFVTN